MSASDLTTFLRELHSIDPATYGPDNVGILLSGLHLDLSDVRRYLTHRTGAYTRNLVYKTDDFEVAILCWDKGASSPVHDHGSQRCWMMAIEGAFDVDNFARVTGGTNEGYARLEYRDTVCGLREGQPDYRSGDNDIHRVSVSPADGEAISLHVYAQPLISCLVYDLDVQRCSSMRLRYDTVAAERVILAS